MKILQKKLAAFALALLISLSGAFAVYADGMIIVKPDPYSDRWDYSDEADQQAYINYQNGLQKMIVGVKMNVATDADAIWLFPVPADPAKVVIDIATDLPQMTGEEVSGKAKASLSEAKDFLYKSQLYPLLFWQDDYYNTSYDMGSSMLKGSINEAEIPTPQDVVVYESLDKEGMTTEIITAKTANGLYDYFKLKGLKVEAGMIPVLDSYIGKDFSFVASWINKNEAVKNTSYSIPSNYPESALRQLLLRKELQNTLVGLTVQYPLIGARRSGDGSVALNLEAAVAYLQSESGKPALDQFLATAEMMRIETAADDDSPVSGVISPLDDMAVPMMTPPVRYPNYPPFSPRERVKGVLVMFPTDKIYFPLLPTSVYESKIVPATIKVVGYVTPELFEGIKNFSKVSYYTNASFNSGQSNNDFFGSNNSTDYTKIEINPPSKYLTNDLWIINKVPMKVAYSSLVGNHPLAVSVILLIICSILTGLLAGLILLKDLRHSIGKLLLLGAANCLSIIGLIAATFYAVAKQDQHEEAALMEKLKLKGYMWKRKTAQILFYLAAITAVFIIAGIMRSGMYVSEGSLIFVYLPVIIAFFGWRAARVRYEDMPLFAELEAKGYSTWTMRKIGPNKKLFIIFFSLLFLAISWLAITLLMLTV